MRRKAVPRPPTHLQQPHEAAPRALVALVLLRVVQPGELCGRREVEADVRGGGLAVVRGALAQHLGQAGGGEEDEVGGGARGGRTQAHTARVWAQQGARHSPGCARPGPGPAGGGRALTAIASFGRSPTSCSCATMRSSMRRRSRKAAGAGWIQSGLASPLGIPRSAAPCALADYTPCRATRTTFRNPSTVTHRRAQSCGPPAACRLASGCWRRATPCAGWSAPCRAAWGRRAGA
jgi:hypothetical protein